MSYTIAESRTEATTWQGTLYTIAYKVQAADKNYFDQFASYRADASPLLNVPSYVYQSEKKYVNPHWLYFLKICSSDYMWGYRWIPYSNTIIKGYGLTDFILESRYWGAHRANRQEAGYVWNTNAKTIPPILNIWGEKCSINDLIYDNATTDDIGSPNYKLNPFTFSSTPLLTVVANGVDVPRRVYTYTVSFINNDNNGFIGINGTFGAGCAPNDTTSGMWLAMDEHAQQYPESGSMRFRITRTMKSAPFINGQQMQWDAAKYGTWTWV